MSQRALDPLDRQIVEELARNARVSHSDLAIKVHLSRNAVRQRIERLERDGVIDGYTIIRGRETEGMITAIMFVYRVDRMRGADVLGALQLIPEVVQCDILSGDFDLLARVEARSADRIQEIWRQISALPGVKNTVTSLTLSTVIRREAT